VVEGAKSPSKAFTSGHRETQLTRLTMAFHANYEHQFGLHFDLHLRVEQTLNSATSQKGFQSRNTDQRESHKGTKTFQQWRENKSPIQKNIYEVIEGIYKNR